ncbi:N-acetyltransferase DgcN [Azospirillum halopraeferens]|uniref:N-acetyltransferase DgcN n=1 Tax=Azospirillum halopraeferens TaxID=34010 RepID=UPI000424F0D0|nr:N-acetyltransferase DgcN [Azospirillum halopraeferens]
MTAIAHPYLLFLGDAPDALSAKTADGVARWRPEWCVGQLRLPDCNADLGLPDRTLEEAAALGARTLLIGVANRGGRIAAAWQDTMLRALDLGFDLAAGLHQRLADLPAVKARADERGRAIHDVRHPSRGFDIGTGARRTGKRLLTVGTDCSVGKMYTALALEREMRARGLNADFRATGQTGILIAGDGVSVDAVVSDFVAGAVEWLTPENDPDHWDVVEGQASVLHPSYAGVTLGLVHGSQPDAMVLCHEPTRRHMRGLPHRPVPGIEETIAAHVAAARVTNPDARVIGLSINTAGLTAAEADCVLRDTADAFGLPTVDPLRTGAGPLVDALQDL